MGQPTKTKFIYNTCSKIHILTLSWTFTFSRCKIPALRKPAQTIRYLALPKPSSLQGHPAAGVLAQEHLRECNFRFLQNLQAVHKKYSMVPVWWQSFKWKNICILTQNSLPGCAASTAWRTSRTTPSMYGSSLGGTKGISASCLTLMMPYGKHREHKKKSLEHKMRAVISDIHMPICIWIPVCSYRGSVDFTWL